MRVFRGYLLHISGDATIQDAANHLVAEPDGAVVADDDGTIVYSGAYPLMPASFADAPQEHSEFILPGFVDTHMHFPQTFAVDSYGGGELLEWLSQCIFPAEARLKDPHFAAGAARAFCRRRVAVGTTAAMVFGSAFPDAQDLLCEVTESTGLRMVTGRGIQTVGPPAAEPLLTSDDDAIALCRNEIQTWHGRDLIDVAVVPRFALSVTPSTLRALGDLYEQVRGDGVYFHTHLNENNRPGDGEVDATTSTYGITHYLDAYDGKFLPGSKVGGPSLLGRRSIMAHAVHCQPAELDRMAQTGTSIAHCPTSQLFLGSGIMPWRTTIDAGITVSLGSDIGAGDEWLMSRVANDCYKQHMSEPVPVAVHPAQLLHVATLSGAQALDRDDTFGNLDTGKAADIVQIDSARWEPLALALEGARSPEETLFALMMSLRESAISGVWVRGRKLVAPDPAPH